MVATLYNKVMERHELQLTYQLGDIKGLETVAHYERKDDTIFFVKTLTIADVWKVLNKAEEIRSQGKRPEKEKNFELDPDGKG